MNRRSAGRFNHDAGATYEYNEGIEQKGTEIMAGDGDLLSNCDHWTDSTSLTAGGALAYGFYNVHSHDSYSKLANLRQRIDSPSEVT
jgi:hypothetical protein